MENRKLILVALCHLLFSVVSLGEPGGVFRDYVKNIPSSEYKGDTQIWAVEQDGRGFTYFAAGTKMSVFDGYSWVSYEIDSQCVVRDIRYDDRSGRLYCAGDNFFGYWLRNEAGVLVFTCLYKNPEPLKAKVFWRILPIGQDIIVQTHSDVFLFSESEALESLASGNVGYSFKTGGEIFAQVDDAVYRLNGNEFVRFAEGVHDRLVSFDKTGRNEYVGVGETSGFHKFTFSVSTGMCRSESIFQQTGKALSELKVFTARRLEDGSYLLGTVVDGAYKVTPDGKISEVWDTGRGVEYSTILSILESASGNVIMGADGGISVAVKNSAVRLYHPLPNKLGYVYIAATLGDNLYLGTNKGLFRVSGPDAEPELIPGSQGQIWNMYHTGKELSVIGDKGLYRATIDGKYEIVYPEVKFLTPVRARPGMFCASDRKGLFLLDADKDGHLRFRNRIGNFDKPDNSVFFDKYGFFWVDYLKGVTYRLSTDKNLQSVTSVKKYSVGDNPDAIVKAFQIDGDLVFTSGSKCYTYHPDADSIKLNKYYTGMFSSFGSENLCLLQVGQCIFNHNKDRVDMLERMGCTAKVTRDIFFNSEFEQIPPYYRRPFKLNDTTVACGFSGCLAMLELNDAIAKVPPEVSIYRVSYMRKDDSFNVDMRQPVVLPDNAHTIKIWLSSTTYTNLDYRLDGGPWKNISDRKSLVLRYLDGGEHTIEIQWGNRPLLTFNFEKKKPVTSRWWFVLLCALCTGALVALVLYVYKRRVRRIKRRYEARQRELLEKEKIVHQNEMLSLELRERDKKLAIQTLNSISTNNILDSISEELASLAENGDSVNLKSAVGILKKYRKEDGSWKQFEVYFNSIFDGFFDRLVERYPNLTGNDMKICAYIKLGMTTKEIASQLNIELSSAESARYRLRKNMGISQTDSLREIIQKI